MASVYFASWLPFKFDQPRGGPLQKEDERHPSGAIGITASAPIASVRSYDLSSSANTTVSCQELHWGMAGNATVCSDLQAFYGERSTAALKLDLPFERRTLCPMEVE